MTIILFVIQGNAGTPGTPGRPGKRGEDVSESISNCVWLSDVIRLLCNNIMSAESLWFPFQGQRGDLGSPGTPGIPGQPVSNHVIIINNVSLYSSYAVLVLNLVPLSQTLPLHVNRSKATNSGNQNDCYNYNANENGFLI